MRNVLFLAGGVGCEHEVSLISCSNIIANLDRSRFAPFCVIISKENQWLFDGVHCSLVKDFEGVFLIVEDRRFKIDIAFPVLHGVGEDGTVQGLFESFGLPYVGNRVLASAVSMDKIMSKRIASSYGIPVVPFLEFDSSLSYSSCSAALSSSSLFVKPSNCGSSVGVNKVRNHEQFVAAILEAKKYDSRILVERAVVAREIECSVFFGVPSILGEIIPSHEFYTYNAKYIDPNGARLVAPIELDSSIVASVQDLALRVFLSLDCRMLARVDFFLDAEWNVFFNEINTMPGFTKISMFPRLCELSGISYPSIISRLLDAA